MDWWQHCLQGEDLFLIGQRVASNCHQSTIGYNIVTNGRLVKTRLGCGVFTVLMDTSLQNQG
jgi:hypothetical protein